MSRKKTLSVLQNFPAWMNEQIENDFQYFLNKQNDVEGTIENFKRLGCLSSAQLVRIKIKNNKFRYQNFLPVKFHPRLVRLLNFFKRASKAVQFPDCDFLYSLHDSFDNTKWLDCLKTPVFCISKLKGNNKTVLFPHVEWMEKNDKLLDLVCKAALQFNWDKKIKKAFWRGTITGSEEPRKNVRFKIVKFASQYPEYFDAALTNISLNEQNENLLKPYYADQSFHPRDQLKYRYLLAIDGNAFPGCFFWQLYSNSLILKNQSSFLEWYYKPLKDNEHFIEFANEDELLQKIVFLNQNDDLVKTVINNANSFANRYLSNESVLSYIYKVLDKYSFLRRG